MSLARSAAVVGELARKWMDVSRACAKCGTPSWRGTPLFCPVCDWQLRELEQAGRGYEHGFLSRWLFLWTPSSEPLLGTAIRSLKVGYRAQAWHELAGRFSLSLLQSGGAPRGPLVFVPPPSRNGKRDHARAWAEALAAIWHGSVLDSLVYEEAEGFREQKALGAAERKKRRFRREKILGLPRPATLVFVDDVVTTGATARAAHQALGKPKRFEAWALANRPKLAGAGRF